MSATADTAPRRTLRGHISRSAEPALLVVLLIVLACLVTGYIGSQLGVALPGWVPLLGRSYLTINAEFQTAQAVQAGQGQSVTIAGVRVGLISGVHLHDGVAVVTMHIDRGDGPIYRNATLLLRPKSELKDMTVEMDPGTPAAGTLRDGGTLPISQTAPDINLDELLASLDADTRSYLLALISSGGQALDGQGPTLSADLRRLDPTTLAIEQISSRLVARQSDISAVVRDLALLTTAIGDRDTQLSELVDASNSLFATFAHEDASVSSTVAQLPGALSQVRGSLTQLAGTAHLTDQALSGLLPTAQALAPAGQALTAFFAKTRPVITRQIGPFTHAAQPAVAALATGSRSLAAATPKLSTTLGVLNTLFNELAYPGSSTRPGYLFYLPWAAHNLDSVVASADASGAMARGEVLLAPSSEFLICSAPRTNPSLAAVVDLLKPPFCASSSTP